MWGLASRLIVIHPQLKIPLEMIIKGNESVILTPDACLKYSTSKKIKPVDSEGKEIERK